MLSDLTNSSELQPLLKTSTNGDSKKTPISKKLVVAVSLLLIALTIVAFSFFDQNKTLKKNAFTFTNEWSVLEEIDSKYIPKQWTFDSLCDDENLIELTFAIKQQNTDKIHEKLYEVSNPRSDSYGQHWTMEEIHEYLEPTEDSLDVIKNWLAYYKIDESAIQYLTINKDFIRIQTNVQVANEMLNTEYAYWTNSKGVKHIRVKEGYFVPTTIAKHLDFISPSLRFPPSRHTSKIEKIEVDISSISSYSVIYNTPERIRSLYLMDDYIDKAAATNNYQAIAEFEEEWFTNSDIETFWETFGIQNATIIRVPSTQPSGYGDESELDLEYITSTGSGITTYAWDVEDDLFFVTLVQQILENDNQPSVISISYGGDEQANGVKYCSRANLEFAKLGLYGVTALASSGDSGVTGDSDECTTEYYPSFPASSPYVIAVGGTIGGSIPSDASTSTGEEAWVLSGGGFSWFFARQSWQDAAVEEYFDTVDTLPNSTKYNAEGRGYPDISAQSVDFIICWENAFWSVSGTSCSSPSVGGMIALINDLRLQNNKSRLGWVLPALYELVENDSEYFNDITVGYNYGCSDDDYIGFYTNTNWDPVTGMGTPKFSRLFEFLYNL